MSASDFDTTRPLSDHPGNYRILKTSSLIEVLLYAVKTVKDDRKKSKAVLK